jgi:putative PIN family toxin of toxin-antitoxin system
MIRVVLDTNVIVSALLVPHGTQASVLLLALLGHIALYVSRSVLNEYEEVLRRPRLKLQPKSIDAALASIRRVAHLVEPTQTVSISSHESDNRFLECAQTAEANYIVTGNTRHFPQRHGETRTVTGRQFLDILAESENDPQQGPH